MVNFTVEAPGPRMFSGTPIEPSGPSVMMYLRIPPYCGSSPDGAGAAGALGAGALGAGALGTGALGAGAAGAGALGAGAAGEGVTGSAAGSAQAPSRPANNIMTTRQIMVLIPNLPVFICFLPISRFYN